MDRPAEITEASWRKLCLLAEHDPIVRTALDLIHSGVMSLPEALATCLVVQAEKQRILTDHCMRLVGNQTVSHIVIAE